MLGILKQDVETTNRVRGMFFHRIERIGLVLQAGKECMKSLHLYIQIIRTHYSAIIQFNPLNAELNPICYLLALLAHHFLHVSRIRVKSVTLRLIMSYIYIYI